MSHRFPQSHLGARLVLSALLVDLHCHPIDISSEKKLKPVTGCPGAWLRVALAAPVINPWRLTMRDDDRECRGQDNRNILFGNLVLELCGNLIVVV